jgi:hypothetical protein
MRPSQTASEETAERNRGSLARRLDAIIRLLMEQQVADQKLQKKDQVLILDSVGLTSGEIGKIVGRPSKDVSSWIKKLKAGRNRSPKSLTRSEG